MSKAVSRKDWFTEKRMASRLPGLTPQVPGILMVGSR